MTIADDIEDAQTDVVWIDPEWEDRLSEPRSVGDGLAIPHVNRHDDVQLVRAHTEDDRLLLGVGCRRAESGWWAPRARDFPFEALERVLPRYARRSVVPEIVDLIPATSWHASLANLLTKTSWDLLRNEAGEKAGGCEECGVKTGIECHEAWSYDERTGVQTLVRLRALCTSCHETCHLGFARLRGRFEIAFGRLCRINRIRDDERRAYLAEIEGRFMRRSRRAWALDLGMLAGRRLSLTGTMVRVDEDVVAGPTRGGGVVEVPLLGVTLEQAKRTLRIS
jgi:hypothetical protein